MPLSLDTLLVQPVTTGSFVGSSGSATLPTGTTAGSTVLLVVSTAQSSAGGATSVTTPSGFVADSGTQISGTRTYLFRRSDVPASETSWTLTGSVSGLILWQAYEVAGLDLVAPVDVTPSPNQQVATSSGTTINAPTTQRSTTYDGLQVAVHAVWNAASSTVPTISAQSGGLVEQAEIGAANGSFAGGVACAMATTQQLATFTSTATSSITMSASSAGGAVVLVYTAQGAKREPNVAHFWAFFPGVSSTPAGLATGNTGLRYLETATGSPAITADGLQLTGSASIQNVTASIISVSTQTVRSAVVRVRFRLDSASADLELFSVASTANVVVRYINASTKLGLKIGTGTEQVSDATVTTGTWYSVDFRLIGTTTAYTCDWQVDYGSGPVAQTQATFTAGSAMATYTPTLGWTASSTGTVTYAHALYSVVAGHYPLGDWTMALLKVDPAGTLTISGTTANFNTFTANGTMAAWDATVARGAIDEAPPTVGGSADGFAQVTAAATDYVEVPMETYQAVPSGSARAVRMLACGWAASATAATLGFRGYEGSAETNLIGAQDVNFDNTSTPAWACAMYRPTNGWTQAKLDALAFRVGFSDDATPDLGIHAIYAEVAVQNATTQTLFGSLASQTLDSNSAGILGVTATPPAGYDGTLHYEDPSATDVGVTGGTSHTETIDAPDAPTVAYVAFYPPPEDLPDA